MKHVQFLSRVVHRHYTLTVHGDDKQLIVSNCNGRIEWKSCSQNGNDCNGKLQWMTLAASIGNRTS